MLTFCPIFFCLLLQNCRIFARYSAILLSSCCSIFSHPAFWCLANFHSSIQLSSPPISAIPLSEIVTSFCSIFHCPAVPIIFCRRPPIQYLAILKFDILLGSSYFTCYRPSIPFSAIPLSNIWSHVQNSELFCPYVQYFDVLLSKTLPFFYPIFGRTYLPFPSISMSNVSCPSVQYSAVPLSNILLSWCPIRCRPHGQNYASYD